MKVEKLMDTSVPFKLTIFCCLDDKFLWPNLCESLDFEGQVYNLPCSFYISYLVRGQI